MPSPIARTISGYAILSLWSDSGKLGFKRTKSWLPFYGVFVAVMADLDFFIPQILTGDRYHHGFTHSITFAVGVALVAWGIKSFSNWREWIYWRTSLSATGSRGRSGSGIDNNKFSWLKKH